MLESSSRLYDRFGVSLDLSGKIDLCPFTHDETDITIRFPDMFENVGIANSAGIAAGLLVAVSVIPTIIIHWKMGSIRKTEQER